MTSDLQTLKELSSKKRESNFTLKRISASPGSGLSKFRMSTEGRNSRCKLSTFRSARNPSSLIATSRPCGKEKKGRNNRESFRTMDIAQKESSATLLVTLLPQLRRSSSNCLIVLPQLERLLIAKTTKRQNQYLPKKGDQGQIPKRIFFKWTTLKIQNLSCITIKDQYAESHCPSSCSIRCQCSTMTTILNQSKIQWKMP